MIKKGPALPTWLAAGTIGIAIGSASGYLVRDAQVSPSQTDTSSAQRGGGAGGRGGGGRGGAGGMGGGGQQQPGTMLARMVRSVGSVEKVQGKGLSPDQAKSLLPILNELKAADKIPEKDAQSKLDSIEKILSAEQRDALQALAPGRGAGGGAGGGGAGGRPGGGPSPGGPGGPGGMGGMGGGMAGQQPDPEKPFASDRNKQALDDLLVEVQAKAK